jgi:hypothetical protein
MSRAVRFSRAMARAEEVEPDGATRRLSLPLLAGMLAAAPLFVWLFLRPGYRASLRRAAFFYAAVTFAMTLVGRLAE